MSITGPSIIMMANITTTTTKSPETIALEDAANNIFKWVAPFVLFFGVIGNTLSICVLAKGKVGKLPTCTLLIALAIADSAALLTGLLRYFIKAATTPPIDVRTLTRYACPVHTFLVYLFVHNAVWILVLVTIERFISVIFPVRAKFLCTQPRMLMALVTVFGTLFVLNSHLLYGVRASMDKDNVTVLWCSHVDKNYIYFWNKIWVWLDLAVLSIIPFIIILSCNIMIIVKVNISQRSINKLRNSTVTGSKKHRDHSSDSKVTNMTAMLLSVNFVFLITTLPSCIYLAFWTDLPPDTTNYGYALHELVMNSVMTWTYVSNAINFLLYCLSGPRFRQQFIVFICQFCKKPRVQPNGTVEMTCTTQMSSRQNRIGSSSRLRTPSMAQILEDKQSTLLNGEQTSCA